MSGNGNRSPEPMPGELRRRRPARGLGLMISACVLCAALLVVLAFLGRRVSGAAARPDAEVPALCRAVVWAARGVWENLTVVVPVAGVVLCGLVTLPLLLRSPWAYLPAALLLLASAMGLALMASVGTRVRFYYMLSLP